MTGTKFIQLPIFRCSVHGVSVTFSNRNDKNQQLGIANLINQTVTDTSSFDFIAVLVAAKLGSRLSGYLQSFSNFLLQLLFHSNIETLPFD